METQSVPPRTNVGCVVKVVALVALASAILAIAWLGSQHCVALVLASVDFFREKTLRACATYVAAYVVVSMSGVPLTPFEVLTGFCFGIPLGIVLDLVGRLLGASLSFLAARQASRCLDDCPCCGNLKSSPVLRGVGRAVEQQGLRFLVLFNLAYVPVAVKNYGLGFVPEVPLHLFLVAICIVEVPMASIWASVGNEAAISMATSGNATDAASSLFSGAHHGNSTVRTVLLVLGIGSVLIVMRVIQTKVTAELASIRASQEEATGEDGYELRAGCDLSR